MIKQIAGKALPQEIVEQIVERTDGVPLFIEELTKAVVESGVLADAGDHYTMTGPLPDPLQYRQRCKHLYWPDLIAWRLCANWRR